jgi:general secretion pathway protein D
MRLVKTTAFLVVALAGCATMTEDNRLATRGFNYIDEGDMRAAEEELNAALDVNPDNPYALLNLGVVYEATGRTDDARDYYIRVIESETTAIAARSTVDAERGEKLVDIAERNLDSLR